MRRATANTETNERPPVANGVGDSQRFGGNDPEISEANLSDPRHMSNCTVNGERVPEHLWALLPYELTDQGSAERELANFGKPKPSGVSITRDELHGRIGQRGEDLSRGMRSIDANGVVRSEIIERGIQPYDASDPMRELVLEHVPVGMRPLFLSSRRITATGSTRGYTIARDERGEPIRLGTSILGYIPEDRAIAIQKGFEDKSREAQREIYEETAGLKQEESLRGGKRGPSHSFENPGPAGFDDGLHSQPGEDFSL
jgi:hypothetical protein